jgi:Protein of unknown function with PCYCGC motif
MPPDQARFPRREFLLWAVGFGAFGAAAAVILPGIDAMAMDARKPLPGWASANARTARAYHAAMRRPELFARIDCYCGCMQSALQHRNLRDCFLHADGTFEAHAAGCETCVDQAIDADTWSSQLASTEDILQRTSDKYDQFGCSTRKCIE